MTMENLSFNANKTLDTSKLVRIGDLSYFEGPLLSLFEELNSGYLYLFDWVDRDEKHNRWLIYRVSPNHLLKFLHSKISHFELFQRRPKKEVYFVDIDSRNKVFSGYESFEIENLPESYYPNSHNFFDSADSKYFEKINSVIMSSLSKQKTENEYFISKKIRVTKSIEIKESYSNRLTKRTKLNIYSPFHIKDIVFSTLTNLSFNNIEGAGFKRFITLKKHQNKKQYANRYN